MRYVRASMMGFQDGLVSIGGLVSGLTAAHANVITPSVVAAVAAAVSMGLGEFTSVSSARDAGEGTETPWRAAAQSFVAFLAGAAVPILAVSITESYATMVISTAVAMYIASVAMNTHAERNTFLALVALLASRAFGSIFE